MTMKQILLAFLLLGAIGPGQALANSFSGQATVVRGTFLGLPITPIGDTGQLDAGGGSLETSLVDASVPGLLTVQVAHATAIGMGDASRSEASVANLNLSVGGNDIGASLLMARAAAFCSDGGPSTSGTSDILQLVINGHAIDVGTQPNQTVTLPGPLGSRVIINEQSSSVQNNSAAMDVTALHVIIPGVADVAIASAHADITCSGKVCPQDKDFVTGGGRISAGSGKATFGVAGGIKNGGFWGHLTYIDHGTGTKVKGTGVTAYVVTGLTTRHIEGTCEIDGKGGYIYKLDVDDQGEPGRSDIFNIWLSSGYMAGANLDGGNIQLHTCK
jgi:hypothetical protein